MERILAFRGVRYSWGGSIFTCSTWDGQVGKLYMNGSLIAIGQGMTHRSNDTLWNIGRSPRGSNYADGFIDDLRIYNRALNEAEIKALYKIGNTNNISDKFIVNAIDVNGISFTVPKNTNECTFTAVGSWNEIHGEYDANGAGYYHQNALLPSSPIASLIMERENNIFEFVGINAIKIFSEGEIVKFLFNDIPTYSDNHGFQTVTWSCKNKNSIQ